MEKKKASSKRFVGSGPLEIFIESFGSSKNPCLLLIPGLLSCAEFFSDAFCSQLSLDLFVIRIDLRDMGRSSQVLYEKQPYSIQDLAKDVLAILDHFHVQKAHLLGHAFGGQVAQVFALLYKNRVKSMTLLSSSPISSTKIDTIPLLEGEKEALEKTYKVLRDQTENEKKDLKGSFLESWRYLNGSYPFNEKMASSYAEVLMQFVDHFIHARDSYEKVIQKFRQDLALKVEEIDTSVHVIHGNEDPVSLPRNGRALALMIPNAKLDMIPGMGHVFFNKDLEQKIASLVHSFIKKLGD